MRLLRRLGGREPGRRYGAHPHPDDNRMVAGTIPPISPQAHRRIDQLTFPGLLAAAAWMARWDRRAAAVTTATAAIEGTAYLTTDYPPAVLPLMGFRTHNRVATAHGALVIALGLTLPGISRRGRLALCTLGTMPIMLAALSDTREPQLAVESDGLRNLSRPPGAALSRRRSDLANIPFAP